MKQSLKHLVRAAIPGALVLLACATAPAQTIIRNTAPIHHTAASRKFVRPSDPSKLAKVLAADPSFDPRLAAHLTAKQISSTHSVKAGAASRFQATPYERRIEPIAASLLARANKNIIPNGLGMKEPQPNAKAAFTNSSLPVNFPGLQRTPYIPATLASDISPVEASLSIDVDQDGKTDLVTVQNDGTINVLLNPGPSTGIANWKISSSNQPTLLNDVSYVYATSADMNKDGYPDLIVTDEVNNAAFVYINKKDGTFLPPVEYDFVFSTGTTFQFAGGGISVGDINGDGYPDLVGVAFKPGFDDFGNPLTTTSIITMLNAGDGTLGAALPEQTTTFSGGYATGTLGQNLIADMNKDGKVDLIVPISGYYISGIGFGYNALFYIAILNGNGDGTFAPFPSSIPSNAPTFAPENDNSDGSYYVGDVNGDGNLDLLYSNWSPHLWLALGNGDGTLQNSKAVESDLGAPSPGGAPVINFADVNGDGNIDFVAYSSGYTAVYLGLGGGKFSQTPLVQLISGAGGNAQPQPADFTGDGKVDFIQVDSATGFAGLFPQSNGTFLGVAPMSPAGEIAQDFQVIAVGDVNGDGFPDVIAEDPTNESAANSQFNPDIVAGINDGKGNFTYSTLFTASTLQENFASGVEPIAADLNGDGKADLLLTTNGGLLVALNTGNQTYAAPVAISLGALISCNLEYIDVGDLNGDGSPDIVAAYGGDSSCNSEFPGNQPSGFFILLNNGTGSFTASFQPFGLSAYLVKLADLNGDGKLDLVLSDADSTNLFDYLYDIPGNGDGTFNTGASQYLLENTVVTSIIPGDFDGDGKTDLVVGVLTQLDGNTNPVYGTTGNYVMKGNGDLTFQPPIQYTPGLYSIAGSYADFNADGRPDLALLQESYDAYTDSLTGNFANLINLGGGAFVNGPAAFTAPQAGSGNTFVADFNGDGAIDALISAQPRLVATPTGISELFLNLGAVNLSLTASAATLTQASSETLTATLAPTVSTQSPTGTVSFYDNGTLIGTASLTSGSATLTLSTLPVGSDVITASYSGDSNFNPSTATTSVTVAVAALAPSFTLTGTMPQALTLVQGQASSLTFTIAANATFSGTVSFACSGMPSEASCTISPSTQTLAAGQTAVLTAVVATTAPNNSTVASGTSGKCLNAMGGVSFASLFVLLWPRRKRLRAGVWSIIALIALGLTLTTALTGCGGSGSDKYPGTPAGTSTLTITATSGSITQTTTFTLTTDR